MMAEPFDAEVAQAAIDDMNDTDLKKLRCVNGGIALFSSNPRFRKLQGLLDAEVKRRKEANPDRWATLRDALRRPQDEG